MSRPWMPLYVADYQADTLDLEADQHGVYIILLMIAWRRPDGTIPNDMAWLKRSLNACVADMHGNRFNRLVPPLLNRFFSLNSQGNWHQKRLTKEREKAEKFSEKQRENVGKRYAANKENKGLADTNDLPARALQSQSQSQSQSHSSLRSESARKRGARLPEDWTPGSEDWREATEKLGPEGSVFELSKFRDYWKAVPGAKGVKLDWDATFRNWIRNARPSAGPAALRPENAYRQSQQETKELLNELENFATGRGNGRQADIRVLPGNPGVRQAGVHLGIGRDAAAVPVGGGELGVEPSAGHSVEAEILEPRRNPRIA